MRQIAPLWTECGETSREEGRGRERKRKGSEAHTKEGSEGSERTDKGAAWLCGCVYQGPFSHGKTVAPAQPKGDRKKKEERRNRKKRSAWPLQDSVGLALFCLLSFCALSAASPVAKRMQASQRRSYASCRLYTSLALDCSRPVDLASLAANPPPPPKADTRGRTRHRGGEGRSAGEARHCTR